MKRPVLRYISVCVSILMLQLGCSSKREPEYTYTEPGEKDPSAAKKAVLVEGGWEFQFPEVYRIQEVDIRYDGSLRLLSIHSKTERGWEPVRSVDVQVPSPLVVALDLETDAIRMFPESSKKGRIVFCQFKMAEGRSVFSIPLEKPPFIE